jgi:hypothetical protein
MAPPASEAAGAVDAAVIAPPAAEFAAELSLLLSLELEPPPQAVKARRSATEAAAEKRFIITIPPRFEA